MAIERYDLLGTPVLTAQLDSGDTVTVAIYDKDGNSIALDSNSATENVASSGKYDYELDFTTKPSSGFNYYDIKFSGSLQDVWKSFSWDEDVSKYSGVVFIDLTGGGTAGQGAYVGTLGIPSDNLTDALAIAVRVNSLEISIKGALTLDQSVDGYSFRATRGYSLDSVALNNQSAENARFYNLTITGQMNSTNAYCEFCFLNAVTDYAGGLSDCTIVDSISKKAGASLQGLGCNLFPETAATVEVDMQDSDGTFAMSSFSGIMDIVNMNHVDSVVYIGALNITVTLGASILKGTVVISGVGNMEAITGRTLATVAEFTQINVDGTPGELYVINRVMPQSVYDVYSANHVDTGTIGKSIADTLEDTGTTLPGLINSIPTNPILDTEDGSSFNAIPDMALDSTVAKESSLTTVGDNVIINKKILTGRWKLDVATNTMIFYDTDGTTPLFTFDMKNAAGAAAISNIFERVPQ